MTNNHRALWPLYAALLFCNPSSSPRYLEAVPDARAASETLCSMPIAEDAMRVSVGIYLAELRDPGQVLATDRLQCAAQHHEHFSDLVTRYCLAAKRIEEVQIDHGKRESWLTAQRAMLAADIGSLLSECPLSLEIVQIESCARPDLTGRLRLNSERASTERSDNDVQCLESHLASYVAELEEACALEWTAWSEPARIYNHWYAKCGLRP